MRDSEGEFADKIAQATFKWRKGEMLEAITAGLSRGIAPRDILQLLFSCIRQVCHEFDRGDIYFPEFFLTVDTVQAGINILLPQLKASADQSPVDAKVVLGVVQGDIHDIGKNIVKLILESEGVPVIDLGADVAVDRFIEVAKKESAPVIATSTLMTTTLCRMEELEVKLREQGLKGKIWTIIGGRATSQDFAIAIGADAWTEEAIAGVDIIKQHLQT